MHFVTFAKRLIRVSLLLITVLVLASGVAFTQDIGPGAQAQWDPPTDLSDVAEYWIYFYSVSGGYDLTALPTAKVPVDANEWVIDPEIMEEVPYFGIVISADAAGNQSGPSNEINFKWDSTPPEFPPTNFRYIMKQQVDAETGETYWVLAMLPDPLPK